MYDVVHQTIVSKDIHNINTIILCFAPFSTLFFYSHVWRHIQATCFMASASRLWEQPFLPIPLVLNCHWVFTFALALGPL